MWTLNYNQIIRKVLVNNKIKRILIIHIADFINNLFTFHADIQINHKITILCDINKVFNKNISKYLYKIVISENYNDFILWLKADKYFDHNRSV